MVIFETQNIYSSVQDDTICARFGILFGLQGSQYDDNCVPEFTYPGRQELFYGGYHSEDELYNTIRNGLLSSVSNLIIWESVSNFSVTGCGFTISFVDILSELKDEFPNNVHIVPDGTDTCQYLENYIPPKPNNLIFYGTLGLAALIGLKLLSKK